MVARTLELIALDNFPEVQPGDNLALAIAHNLRDNAIELQARDILIVAQKIVSKAENQYVRLTDVEAGAEAQRIADISEKDPRMVQLILSESTQVLRERPGVVIVEHRLGFVHANAGIDRSNLSADKAGAHAQDEWALLLPRDPDYSARLLSQQLAANCDLEQLPVIINDSMGRAWRNGTLGLAIGCYGIDALEDRNGELDRAGRELQATHIAIADEMAAAASLLMGQADEGLPVVILRGWNPRKRQLPEGIAPLLRDAKQDLFR